jgi:RNA methyltransferase, TrmH family
VARSLLTTIRDLHRRRGRERRGLALAEGIRLVEEALWAGIPLRGAAVSPTLEGTARGKALKVALVGAGVPLAEVSAAELDGLADTAQPQGVVAVIQPKVWALDDLRSDPGSVTLVLDAVQDPGNVGTMLRTALGLGASGLVALAGTAELTNPKVVRGSMGALFRLPAVEATEADFLAWVSDRGVQIWATGVAGMPLQEGPGRAVRPPVALVLGNEGAGVRPTLEAAARRNLVVPLVGGVESLNVAVAAGILLHEVLRDD